MKTRIKCYLTSLVTLLALTGCGDNGSTDNTSNSSSSSNLISSTTSSQVSSSSTISQDSSISSSSSIDTPTSSSTIIDDDVNPDVPTPSSSIANNQTPTSSSSSTNTHTSSSSSSISSSSSSSSSRSSSSSSSTIEKVDYSMYSAKELYNHALEQYLSNNFFTYCTGVTKAKVGISLNQPTVSYKVKDNNNIYFETYTKSDMVSKAEQRIECANGGYYGYRSSKKDLKVTNGNNGYEGSVTWEGNYTKQTSDEFNSTFGHSLMGIINYNVTNGNYTKSITSSIKNSTTNGDVSYTYKVSIKDSDTSINATAGYAIEMQHMSGYKSTFKSAEFTLVVDKDGLLKTIDVIESYSMKVGIISASCSSNFTTYFTKINSINEISKDQRDSYAEMLAAYR